MTAKAVIIDGDPGVDDAVALLLAFASPEDLEILAITTVAGNVEGALTARNARLIRQIAGREDVPVFAGADRPLVRAPVEAGHFHGRSGLGGLAVVEPSAGLARGHAANAIVDLVMGRPAGTVWLAVMGPMTNVALAMALEPELALRLAGVVAMGGARAEGGNITASAEFNIFADPHAAHRVLTSGARVVLHGLDVTHQVRATPDHIEAIRAADTAQAQAAAELLNFSHGTHQPLAGGGAAPLHDPCTIAWLLKPELFTLKGCVIEVEMGSALTLGHTAVEFRLAEPETAKVHWATHADAGGVFALLAERLAR